jgi:DNA repair exonuclease SbcCD ATPase subunit
MRRKIKSIYLDNIKGHFDRKYELGGRDTFHGKNGQGKTAILDAIKLATLGEHDVFGKQGKSIKQLSNGSSEMTAEVEYTDGTNSTFKLKGTTKTTTGEITDPSFRLGLMPDKFWDASKKSKTQHLLDSVMANREAGDLIPIDQLQKSITRVRHKDMVTKGEDSELDTLKEWADKAKATIQHSADIEGLRKLEESANKQKLEASKKYRDLKRFIETEREPKDIDLKKAEELNQELQRRQQNEEELLKAIEEGFEGPNPCYVLAESTIVDDIKQVRAEMQEKMDLAEMEAREIKAGIKDTQEYLTNNAVINKDRVFMDHPPTEGKEVAITATAYYKGDDFMLKDETIRWSDIEDKGIEVNQHLLANLQLELSSLEESIAQYQKQIDEATESITETQERNKQQLIFTKVAERLDEVGRPIEETQRLIIQHHENLENIAYGSYYKSKEKELAKADRTVATLKAIHKVIEQYLTDVTDSIVSDVLGTLNVVTENIIAEEIEWNGSTIGITKDYGDMNKQWIPIEAFSGAQQAVAKIALAVAMAQGSSHRIVVLDELSRLDKDNRRRLVMNLNLAQTKDIIDQYILFPIEGCFSKDVTLPPEGQREEFEITCTEVKRND